jgi:hypothetical protein
MGYLQTTDRAQQNHNRLPTGQNDRPAEPKSAGVGTKVAASATLPALFRPQGHERIDTGGTQPGHVTR